MKHSAWRCFEDLPGLIALPHVWRQRTAQQFAAFTSLCLENASDPATVYACPNHCGCAHSVILRHDHQGAVAVCRCTPEACPDIPLSIAEITPLQVNRARLGRAICNAFSLEQKPAAIPILGTFQIGSWSPAAIPAILTIQHDRTTFRAVVAELAARLAAPFILLAPTASYFDAHSQEHIARARAAFFSLESSAILTEQGALSSVQLREAYGVRRFCAAF